MQMEYANESETVHTFAGLPSKNLQQCKLGIWSTIDKMEFRGNKVGIQFSVIGTEPVLTLLLAIALNILVDLFEMLAGLSN